jgi:hypothetical protein
LEKISREFLVLDLELRRLSICLLGKLASWIDLSLITDPAIIVELYRSSVSGDLQKEAIECLAEIVSKGMSPSDKCRLIDQLGLISHATTNILAQVNIKMIMNF